jgi:hypothetical protein
MIKLLTAISGHEFNYQIGEVVTLDKDYEQRLVDSGQAEKVEKPKKKAKK